MKSKPLGYWLSIRLALRQLWRPFLGVAVGMTAFRAWNGDVADISATLCGVTGGLWAATIVLAQRERAVDGLARTIAVAMTTSGTPGAMTRLRGTLK